jgi:hypothetical protein
MKDKNGKEIEIGDTLHSDWGYDVIATKHSNIDELIGMLVCDDNHSCKNIPYSLNNGEGHTVIKKGLN